MRDSKWMTFGGRPPSPSPPAAVCGSCVGDKHKVLSLPKAALMCGITFDQLSAQACIPQAERIAKPHAGGTDGDVAAVRRMIVCLWCGSARVCAESASCTVRVCISLFHIPPT